MSDLRYAFRTLGHTPVVSAIVILSLALGIGANTAMFSMIDQLLLRTLPVRDARQIVFFYQPGPSQGRVSTDEGGMPSFSYPMFRDLQQQQTPFTAIAGVRSFAGSLSYHNQALSGSVDLVSGNYFEVLGVKAALGRLLSPDDDRVAGGHYVTVLSHSYWTNRLGARPDVLNQNVVINGYPMTIVGVAQAGFRGLTVGRAADVYVPVAMKAQMTPGWDGLKDRKNYWINVFGRIKPGLSITQAAEAINSPYRSMLQEDAKLLNNPSKQMLERFLAKKIILKPGAQGRGGFIDGAKTPMYLLMSITVFVLLIACANAANLLLARATGRRKEIAIRLSIGAGRGRLIRQLLLEACVLSVTGGVLGLFVAQWTMDGLLSFVPPEQGIGFLTSQLNQTVLIYCFGVSVVTGLVFGLFPALQATSPDVAPTLKDQGSQVASSGSAKYFRNSLVIVQVALSLMLLITAGLFSTSLVKLTRVELGIDTDKLMTFTLRPELVKYTPERALAFFEQLEDRIAAIPGVKILAGAEIPVIAGSNSSNNITIEGYRGKGDEENVSFYNAIGPGFFAAMGTPLIAGREFTRADGLTAPRVAVVNETFAKRFFEGRNPIGNHLGLGAGPKTKLDMEIVGVVKDSRYSDLDSESRAVYYVPYRQDGRLGSLYYYVRTSVEPEQFAAQIRREVAALEPNIPVDQLKTMNAQITENIFGQRILSTFAAIFALLATILAAIGLYGVLAYTVARRTREIGIRMALGAHSADVQRLVLRDVAMMLGIGVPIGLAAAVGLGQFVESLLYGVKGGDPLVLLGAAAVLIVVALIAGSVPARRAAKIDPMIALRYE